MLAVMWIRGLLVRRPVRSAGAIIGVALTVALLVAVGRFVTASATSMSARAAAAVPVDWQVALQPNADTRGADAVLHDLAHATAMETVGYTRIAGFSAQTGGTTQTTAGGFALGISPTYAKTFPLAIRLLAGSLDGPLLAQQTAANLHAGVGDTVTILRSGGVTISARVRGIVDLPAADSLFAPIGVSSTTLQAPPDNVILLPPILFRRVAANASMYQIHARLAHDFAGDPAAAYKDVKTRANAVEARLAGTAAVGDNLSARLLGVIGDAAYARVLFLFLGLPGAVLMALLTIAIASSGQDQRRVEQALLRVRGASTRVIVWIAGIEAAFVGVVGAAAGVAVGWIVAPAPLAIGINAALIAETIAAFLCGLGLSAYAIIVPAWRQARDDTPAAAAHLVPRQHVKPLWQALYLDLVLLAVAGIAFWRTAATGYEIVVAPEGVPQAAISYSAFIAPLSLWIGAALLGYRLLDIALARPTAALRRLVEPLSRELATSVAAFISRQRELVGRGAFLASLGFGFAISTAVFNVTYDAQARVEAELTNGADVTVTGSTVHAPDRLLGSLTRLPGVVAAVPLQHRYAYVGNDLQDLYGIDPHRLSAATEVSDAYFESGSAAVTLGKLAQRRDGVLVSRETVDDFRLAPGDRLNLRLQSARDHRYHVAPFTFVGVVREFPTAPRDSFLVANASYVAAVTDAPASEIVLMRVRGDVATVAAHAARLAASLPGARVTDIGQTQRLISSSLTSIDLRGLTALELLFAVLGIAGATGIMLALGFRERHRSFVVLWAIGARPQQLASYWWSEALLVAGAGSLVGSLIGFVLAAMLVKILTGVFDPPPQTLSLPAGALGLFALSALASTLAAVLAAQLAMRSPSPADLREL